MTRVKAQGTSVEYIAVIMSSTEEDARSSDSLSVQDIIIRENKEGSSGSDVMTVRDSIFMTGMDVPDGGQKIHLATRIGGLHHIKKKVTDGMMDIALLTANANQLKFIITYNQKSPTYYLTFGMVVLSLVLQIMVGIALILRVSLSFIMRFQTN